MRLDFYDGRLPNKWNPRDLIIELNNRREIDLRKLQQELNYIQFELINNFNGYDIIRFIRFIFNEYISGKGYKAITNQLNKLGYKTKKEKTS